jgi:hypothetical protein
VALDRQSIEKKDFPTGSNGYDPQAVDAHLSGLADELAEFKSAARRRTEHMASSASDQVRSIIQAAEVSAAEIQRAAEAEAHDIREEAHHEAHATRERAIEEVREHVGRVSDATSSMMARLDGMESELSGLIETLRGGTGRLDSDLRELSTELEHAAEVVKPPSRAEFQLDPPPAPPEPDPEPAVPSSPSSEDWGSSTSTGDWGSAETPSSEPAPAAAWDAGPADPPESRWGEGSVAGGSESTGGVPSWDSGASSPGWGTAEDEQATADEGSGMADDHGASSGYEAPAAAPDGLTSSEAWTSETAPVEPGSTSFPDSPSAPPGDSGPAPYGEPSSASFGERAPGAAAPPEAAGQAEEADDSEGARLIALNMALNGTPRDETARYLSENFQLSDRDGLLDEVYASVEG